MESPDHSSQSRADEKGPVQELVNDLAKHESHQEFVGRNGVDEEDPDRLPPVG